jgi:hypothetical protein
MAANRCSTCSIDWPANHTAFSACRSCDGATAYVGGAEGLSLEEAWPLARRMDFERDYKQRGERESKDPEFLAKVARIDAVVAEVKMLEAIPVDGDELEVPPIISEHFGRDAYLLEREG